ncbi:unnamed protein product, partial [Haemonchus placei]|uniref:Pox_D5 domain-containing protein n=1 Tax=Haemonchus placei TaxID=6290 RepID=A0A0N4VUL2_HAEPC
MEEPSISRCEDIKLDMALTYCEFLGEQGFRRKSCSQWIQRRGSTPLKPAEYGKGVASIFMLLLPIVIVCFCR